MTKKKIIIISVIALAVLLIIGGGSYAWFNYYQVSNVNNLINASNIQLDLNEGKVTVTLINIFPETKEEARARDDNTLTFTVEGNNTSSKAIMYNILLNQGTSKNGKTRFLDNELRFDLVEINGNTETYLVDGMGYSTLSDTSIYDNIISGNTNNVSHTYRLRAWIDEGVTISETETGSHVYTPNNYKNLYATVKITVSGETVNGDEYTVTFDANGGTVPISTKTVVAGQNYGYLPTPTKEGYTFLGWNGKNMFNVENILGSINGVQYDNNTEYYKFSTGNVYSLYSETIPQLNSFTEATQYSFSFTGYEEPTTVEDSTGFRFVFTHNNGGYDYVSVNSLTEFSREYTSRSGLSLSNINVNYGYPGWIYLKRIQLEEGSTSTAYEPYYITSDTTVVQNSNHTLKAIWQAN